MKFRELAVYLEKLEKTSSRNEITEILADLFKKTSVLEIDKVVYLALGTLAPTHVGIDFNIAEKMMMRAIAKAYGVNLEKVKAEFKKRGVGEVRREKLPKSQSFFRDSTHSQ